ncbi:hypothetical protein EPUS_08826 [Endocarpon pusillum Z07020]|uniref:non-specific serine/threonine protein kinase n=1 Tax=Endocarpon pusillum (strain Z07020 / HMAS-L-300199) TaxID=1263415 RepID=U1GBD9_ENDPU|nr:uncharacterized protein EPUS_08826 [Endocarpon pusillum Z07020]ERF69353.1 hypothetical protein EPUS_08826 [Endocarpon pusillum Z07020]
MATESALYFRLLPLNEAANRIVLHPRNTSFLEELASGPSFRITLGHSPKKRGTLLSFGKVDCDIYLIEQCLPDYLCHFQVHPKTCELILQDDSSTRMVRLSFGKKTSQKYSLQGHSRQRVISKNIKAIQMHIYDAFFEICFPGPGHEIARDTIVRFIERNGLKPWTRPGGRRRYALQEPQEQARIAYEKRGWLGEGSYGNVLLVVDLRTGDHLALKVFGRLNDETEEERKSRFRKEAELLKAAAHKNIARFIDAQERENGTVMELFMDVYQGSLRKLMSQSPAPSAYLGSLTEQILDALVFLAEKNIIHRDIKPENILHDKDTMFYLADFGISKEQNDSFSPVGTREYMAPEMFCALPQTSKADVFSMGLVMLEVLGLWPEGESRVLMLGGHEIWHDSIRLAASQHRPEILPMLAKHSEERFTAARCLTWFFGPKSAGNAVFQPMQMHTFTDSPTDRGDPPCPPGGEKQGFGQVDPGGYPKNNTKLQHGISQQTESGNSQFQAPARETSGQLIPAKDRKPQIHHSADPRKQDTLTRLSKPTQTAGNDRPGAAQPKRVEDSQPSPQKPRTHRPQPLVTDTEFLEQADQGPSGPGFRRSE